LQRLDDDSARYLSNCTDITNSLDYFSDIVIKSFVISVYSYFEFKIKQFAEISSKHLGNKKIEKYAKSVNGKQVSSIQKYNSFLIREIVPKLKEQNKTFSKIIKWNYIRNKIVHNNSIINNESIDLKDFKSITIDSDTIKFKDKTDLLEFLSLIDSYLEKIVELINLKYDLIHYNPPYPKL